MIFDVYLSINTIEAIIHVNTTHLLFTAKLCDIFAVLFGGLFVQKFWLCDTVKFFLLENIHEYLYFSTTLVCQNYAYIFYCIFLIT